jgi:hypothetical protein
MTPLWKGINFQLAIPRYLSRKSKKCLQKISLAGRYSGVSPENSTKFINGLNLKPITQERLISWYVLILKTAGPN